MIKLFTSFANAVSRWTGRPLTFIACIALVTVWAVSGPLFGFSDTWQLVINTSTTIITFLMVFLIQNTQNRDNAALQAKLDELIKVTVSADNMFIGIEHLTDEELEKILQECERSAKARRTAPKTSGTRKAASRKVAAPSAAAAKAIAKKAEAKGRAAS